MSTEFSSFDEMVSEARQMQHGGKYINGRIFHALVNEIAWLRGNLCLALDRCRYEKGFDNEHGPIGCRLEGVDGLSCRCRSIGSLSSHGEVDPFADWVELDADSLPDPKLGPYLTTNNPAARNAHGQPSHVWLVSMFHRRDEQKRVTVSAFRDDGYSQLWGLRLYKPIFPKPACRAAAEQP